MVLALFAIAGAGLLLQSHAATTAIGSEAESGQAASVITTTTDATAERVWPQTASGLRSIWPGL